MDSEGKIRSEIRDNSLVYTGLPRWAYFRQKRVILIYGLLGLSYLLILTFFIIVLSRDSKSGSSQTELSTALSKIKNDVANITQKLDKLQKTFKDSVGCDDSEWITFSDSCYYFSITKSNWMKARSFCVRKGSDLVAITSEQEQRFLSSKVNQKKYWIGLNEDDGNWTSVDETDYKTLIKFWKKGEPSKNDKKVSCAYIETSGDWLAIPCSSNEIYAICEKKMHAFTS